MISQKAVQFWIQDSSLCKNESGRHLSRSIQDFIIIIKTLFVGYEGAKTVVLYILWKMTEVFWRKKSLEKREKVTFKYDELAKSKKPPK